MVHPCNEIRAFFASSPLSGGKILWPPCDAGVACALDALSRAMMCFET